MKKQVVKNKNALGLKLWFKLLGYKNKDYVFKNGGWYLLHSKLPKDTTPIDQPNIKY